MFHCQRWTGKGPVGGAEGEWGKGLVWCMNLIGMFHDKGFFFSNKDKKEVKGKLYESRVRPAGPGGGAFVPSAQLVSWCSSLSEYGALSRDR
jgi:hypothetical protein